MRLMIDYVGACTSIFSVDFHDKLPGGLTRSVLKPDQWRRIEIKHLSLLSKNNHGTVGDMCDNNL